MAAVEQYLRDTTPPPAPAEERPCAVGAAALREGVDRISQLG